MTTKFTQDSPAEGSRETVEKALAHATDNGTKPRTRSKIAETARLEREQGGQPQAHDSGDPKINAQPHQSRQVRK
jgi:hypothetical protein